MTLKKWLVLIKAISEYFWALQSVILHPRRRWYLSRVACLGLDVLMLLDLRLSKVNIQKGRVDVLMTFLEKPIFRPAAWLIAPWLAQWAILSLIIQQQFFSLNRFSTSPEFVIMDSYAELTDQLFVARDTGRRFLANYSDIKQSSSFDAKFDCKGLLPIEQLETAYRSFFTMLITRWPEVPIYFLHFPIKLETREKFVVRYRNIRSVIESLTLDFPNLHSIAIDESEVSVNERDKVNGREFPYHYNLSTYELFVGQLLRYPHFGG